MSKRAVATFAGVLFIVFLIFSYFTAQQLFNQWDYNTMVQFQQNFHPVVDFPFSLVSIIGSAEVTVGIWFLLVFYTFIKRYFIATLCLMLFPISVLIEIIGKTLIHHPAPPAAFYRGVIHLDFPSHYVSTAYAYPSGHVTRLAFLLALAMVYLLYKLPQKRQLPIQLTIFGIIAVVCISRIYLGEHWPTDVVGGLLLGSSFGIIAGLSIPSHPTKSISIE